MHITPELLKKIVETAELSQEGDTANYIPELAHVNKDLTALGIVELGEAPVIYSNDKLDPTKHWKISATYWPFRRVWC